MVDQSTRLRSHRRPAFLVEMPRYEHCDNFQLAAPPTDRTRAAVPQAREREREATESLSLLEEQLSVKEKTLAMVEADLENVRAVWTADTMMPQHGGWFLGRFGCRSTLGVRRFARRLACLVVVGSWKERALAEKRSQAGPRSGYRCG